MFGNFMIGVKSKDICKKTDVQGIEHADSSVFFYLLFLIRDIKYYQN